MKLNNKGFVATATLYSAFLFLMIIVLLILKILNYQKDSLKFSSDVVKKHINYIVPYDVKTK